MIYLAIPELVMIDSCNQLEGLLTSITSKAHSQLEQLRLDKPESTHMAFFTFSNGVYYLHRGIAAPELYEPDIDCSRSAFNLIRRRYGLIEAQLDHYLVLSHTFNLQELDSHTFHQRLSPKFEFLEPTMKPEEYLNWCILGYVGSGGGDDRVRPYRQK